MLSEKIIQVYQVSHKKRQPVWAKGLQLQRDCNVQVESIGTTTCTMIFISNEISEAFNHLTTISQFNVETDRMNLIHWRKSKAKFFSADN